MPGEIDSEGLYDKTERELIAGALTNSGIEITDAELDRMAELDLWSVHFCDPADILPLYGEALEDQLTAEQLAKVLDTVDAAWYIGKYGEQILEGWLNRPVQNESSSAEEQS